MVSLTFRKTAIILIISLIFVQGASALTIEQAPLNPEFVAYTEALETGDTNLFSIECSGDSCPANGTDQISYPIGYIPAPAVAAWPDGYTADEETFTAPLPDGFDLRDEDRVTPVRDQGDCGSCWAFAAYGSLESTYLTDTGTAENFSENNMKNLCSNLYPDGYDRDPCNGGNAFMSAAYLTRGSGPIREADDPYALPIPSTISPTDLPPVLDAHDITFLPTRTGPLDNSLLKQTLMEEGALRVRFLVNWSCFSGNGATYYLPDEGYTPLGGHAVTLVGWDDTFPKEAFAVEAPDDGAFILKNSWGTYFGEDGYFYLSYYDRSIDTGNPVLFTGVTADVDQKIYQYDPLGWTMEIGTGTTTTCHGANVFTADSYEELTDVSFYTIEPETAYTIAVFTNVTTPPGDAAPVTWISGTSALPGYHTVSLPKTIALMPGEVFSVVLKVSSPTSVYPLAAEEPIPGYSSGAAAGPGESYVSGDGEAWADLDTLIPDTNVCIKAFTHPLTVVPRDYATIQEAVDAAESGDTIVVEAGTYPEILTLNKPITLLGVGTPVVTTPEERIGAEISADSVTVAGFSFGGSEGASGGIGIMGNNCTLYDIDISGYTDGLHIEDTRRLSLSTIALHDNTNNLEFTEFTEEPGNSIDETVTVNGRPVIYREGVSGEIIDASSDAGAVICVNCTDITIRDTTTEAIKDGIALHYCDGVTVENVTTDMATSGLLVYDSDNVSVRGSTFGPNLQFGIQTEEISGFLAKDNEISCQENGCGIRLTTAEDITITNNTISGGMAGVMGMLMINSTMTGNTISDATGCGIGLFWAGNLALTGNTMDTTMCGISGESLFDIQISDNTIRCSDSGCGLDIYADNADITGNTIEKQALTSTMALENSIVRNNRFSGAAYPDLSGSGEDVYIYCNDFSMTGEYTAPEGEQNGPVWHSPTAVTYWYHGNPFTQVIGNYWSTYNGTDINNDGIGEAPFAIHPDETDPFPLIEPISGYLDHATTAPSNEDPSADMAMSPALKAGESATLTFTGTAVQAVTVTAAEGTGRILLTVDPAGNGPDELEGPVYQYISAHLRGMTDDEIRGAVFSFRVPAAWLREEGLAPAAIALWRYHDGAWQELPTVRISEEGGWVHFEATTPGFSSFAIAGGAEMNLVTENSAPETGGATADVDITVTAEPGDETGAEPVPPVTVAIPEMGGTETPAESAATSQESPLGIIPVIAGSGACAAISFRRR